MLGKRFGGRVQPHRGLKSLVTLGKSRTVLRFSPRGEQGPGWLHLGLSNLSHFLCSCHLLQDLVMWERKQKVDVLIKRLMTEACRPFVRLLLFRADGLRVAL